MQASQQITKQDERQEMLKLMEERDNRTPERPEPNWIVDFWLARGTLT